MITDLTRGSSRKMLWMFSIPMLLSVAFQQVYQIADSIIAGQFIGEAALAAVGASHPITMIFMAVAVGSNIGCAVVVSRLFGAKKYSALKTAICTIFCACHCGQRGSDACRHFRRKCHASPHPHPCRCFRRCHPLSAYLYLRVFLPVSL